jgi:hypothetical protein
MDRGVAGEGDEWYRRPGWQIPKVGKIGGKINISNKKIIFFSKKLNY